MRHPEKHIPDLWVDIDIFTGRHLLSGWVAAIKYSKIDYNGNKKTPLWDDRNRKIYPVTGHSTPGSFLITFSRKEDAMEYNSAIKSFGERKRSEDFLTPEVWFGFHDEEGYNLYIEISHGLMDSTKTTPTRFNGLVMYPQWLEVQKSVKTKRTIRDLTLNLLPPADSHELQTSAV